MIQTPHISQTLTCPGRISAPCLLPEQRSGNRSLDVWHMTLFRHVSICSFQATKVSIFSKLENTSLRKYGKLRKILCIFPCGSSIHYISIFSKLENTSLRKQKKLLNLTIPCVSIFPIQKISHLICQCILAMETKGFEPSTPCLQGRCSPNWAMSPGHYSIITIPNHIAKWA